MTLIKKWNQLVCFTLYCFHCRSGSGALKGQTVLLCCHLCDLRVMCECVMCEFDRMVYHFSKYHVSDDVWVIVISSHRMTVSKKSYIVTIKVILVMYVTKFELNEQYIKPVLPERCPQTLSTWIAPSIWIFIRPPISAHSVEVTDFTHSFFKRVNNQVWARYIQLVTEFKTVSNRSLMKSQSPPYHLIGSWTN